jgi:mRNA interferase MazF
VTQGRVIRPWQLWLTDFGLPVGTEQGGLRPAIVVGSEDHCQFPINMALVVPLTTRDRDLPHHVPIDSTQSGLKRPSWARTENITAVSTERFRHSSPLGTLSEAEAELVRRWVHRMLA